MNAPALTLAPPSVMQNLRVLNAEQRTALGEAEAEIVRLRGLLHEQQRLTSAFQARVDKLKRRVSELKGEVFDEPHSDSICVYVPITDTLELVVDAEYASEIPATRDEPGEDAVCEPGCVLIQGEWVYIADLIQRLTDKREIRRLVEKRADELRMQGEEP